MIGDRIPEDVREFILAHIDSVAQLEALLLLRQHRPEQWDTSRLAKRLYIDEANARSILSALTASNLVTTDGDSFQFGPQNEEDSELIDSLAANYGRFLVPITKIIHEKGAALHQFANAFKLKKDT